jgi:hypothetical protein
MFDYRQGHEKIYNVYSDSESNIDNLSEEELNVKLQSYEEIEFHNDFNKPLKGLPDTIKTIKWSSRKTYDHILDTLPLGLENLDIRGIKNYNHKLVNLPEGLKKLKIRDYNYPLDNLPKNLEYLSISGSFNLELDSLPLNLKTLMIFDDSEYSQSLNNLPANLETLVLMSRKTFNLDNLPFKLKKLIIKSNTSTDMVYRFDNLPEKLEVLKIDSNNYNEPLDNLPNSLKKLVLESKAFNYSLDNLPNNLLVLDLNLDKDYSHNLNSLPNSIQNLKVNLIGDMDVFNNKDKEFNLTINYPECLKKLKISYKLLCKNLNLPSELVYLNILNYRKNIVIKEEVNLIMPSNLEYFKADFNLDSEYKINLLNISDKLKYYIVGDCILKPITEFPEGLKVMVINSKSYNTPIKNFPDSLEKIYYGITNKLPIPNLPNNLVGLLLDSNIILSDDFVLPNNIDFLGLNPLLAIKTKNYSDSENDYYDDSYNYHYDDSHIEYKNLQEKIINKLPDSIKYLTFDFYFNEFEYKHLPENLKEIYINCRQCWNPEVDYAEYFTSMGCTNNFEEIFISGSEDGSDMRGFHNTIDNYFQSHDYLFDVESKEQIHIYHYY